MVHGVLENSKPREMFVALPVIHIKASVVDKMDNNVYLCPVYKTQRRGPTYVFSLQLKSKFDSGKWTLAGVVSIMDIL
jgi:dynein heavy chain